jgi:NADPH2:quinone reductase
VKAVLCRTLGSPAGLTLEEVPPPALARDQVRIRVHACGVNFPDVLMIAGRYQVQPPLPFSPGAEFSGEIVEVGADSTSFRVGQRVLAISGFGGMAEEVCVAGPAVLAIPEEMDYVTAAGFLLAYGTAWHALKQRAELAPGETLLVLGSAGGVGLAAVEVGKLMGARVIAAAGTADKLRVAERHGADATVNYVEACLKDAVRDLTSQRGADVIFDPVGGALFDDCLRAVAWRGRILIVGFASGSIQSIPANLPLLKGSSLVGVFWGRFTQLEPGLHRQNNAELLDALGEGSLKPHIDRVLPLEQAGKAIQLLADRRVTGKIVVRVRPA